MFQTFPFYRQLDKMDCGPSCVRMIAEHYGKSYSLQYLREHSYVDREGVSVEGICEAAEHIGLTTLAVQLPYESISEDAVSYTHLTLPTNREV